MKRTLLIMLAMVIGMTAIAYTVQAKQAKSEQVNPQKTRKLTIKLISSEDNEPIIFASIQVEGTSIGAVTDINGNAVLYIPTSEVKIIISFVGIKTIEKTIPAGTDPVTLNLTMYPDSQDLE